MTFFAHRGFSAEAPDDTIAGFELAARHGYGIDCDLFPTAKDARGEFDIVASHDNNLLDVAGIDKNITDMTAEEISNITISNGNNIDKYPDEHIPSLGDVLKLVSANGSPLLVEMKGKGWNEEQCEKLISYLLEYNVYDRVIVNSLYIQNLRTFISCAKSRGEVPNTLYTILYYEDMDKKLDVAKKANVNMVSMRSSIINEHPVTILAKVKYHGLTLLTWTAGEEDEQAAAEAMKKLGIRYIAVDSIVR